MEHRNQLTSPAKLQVVIPTHQRPGLLQRTLASLADCRKPAGFLGVTMVENGPQCGARAIVAHASRELKVHYLHLARANKSAALNLVLEHTSSELIIFLDDDVRVDPDILCAYSAAASQTPAGACFGGPLLTDYEVIPPGWVRLPRSAQGWSLPDETGSVSRIRFLGANWAAFADELRAAGGFNTEVGPGAATGGRGQESDMQYRLYNRGTVAVYVKQAQVWHWVPASRCSVEWSIQRARANGVGYGLLSREKGLSGWTAHAAAARLRDFRAASTESSPPLLYSLRLERAWWQGYIAGCLRSFGIASPLFGHQADAGQETKISNGCCHL